MSSQAASSASPPPPSPPPPPPKESLGRRYKFIWPLLIAVNFSIGAYLYTRTNKEENTEVDEPATATLPSTGISTASVAHTSSPPAIHDPVKPIPVDQQRELLKWILEEKRKVKTKDPQEKKQNDEEKALLKQLIRAKSIPSL
ncbi:hypothetical protein L1987_45299 [Smallanthus sonchifolius]|uniref:Uncharacterized protein n=1 Tax=Smallanthus sonchifolius TaxID=185202 RepID=A0ACB9GRY0_9ASTR|nr:hypothetical protein L1987_45299 [Smallanthus sonchifolius]